MRASLHFLTALLFITAGIFAEEAAVEDPVLVRGINQLKLIWNDVEGNPVGSAERQKYLREFLEKSPSILAKMSTKHSAIGGLWTLRALAAYELNDEREASSAGAKMLELGLDTSSNELYQEALAALERKGWLKTEAKLLEERAAGERRQKAEEERLADQRKEAEEKIRKVKRYLGEYRLATIALAAPGSTYGTLKISASPTGDLTASGQGGYRVYWNDNKLLVYHSFRIDKAIPTKTGTLLLTGLFEALGVFTDGKVFKDTRLRERRLVANQAELYVGSETAQAKLGWHFDPGELFTSFGHGVSHQYDTAYRFLKK